MREIIFQATLAANLEADAVHLPLNSVNRARLLSLLPDGEFTFLAISGAHTYEQVIAMNQGGDIVLERGINGTEAVKHPNGSCVMFEVNTAVVKWLICNYDCCTESPCECIEVSITGEHAPDGQVGVPWTGAVIFDGTAPIRVGASSVPSWMSVAAGPNYAVLTGIPPVAGNVAVSVAATNCAEKVAVASLTFNVS